MFTPMVFPNPALYLRESYYIADLFARLALDDAIDRWKDEAAQALNTAMSAEKTTKRQDIDERYPFA